MQRTTGWALIALALLSACGDPGMMMNGDAGPSDKPHSTGGNSWTVLVYMAADNDLEPFALQDLTEMMKVGSGNGLNIVVQVDRADGYSNDGVGNLNNFTDAKRVLVKNGELEVVQEMGEINTADPATLADFVTWGLKTYPADRTALVFWDHGGGWTGFGVDDSANHKLLNLTEIDTGVKNGLAGVPNAKPFTLIGFDACLMATWEVALTMSAHGEYLLASEELEPGHGWDWEALGILSNNPSTDAIGLGKNIIAMFKQQAINEKTQDTITLSLVDMYRLVTLGKAIDKVIGAFDMTKPEIATAFGRGQQGSQKFGDNPDPAKAQNMVDLAHLVELTAKESMPVSMVNAELQAALASAVIDHTEGAARTGGKGLAIYFPPGSAYYKNGYDDLTAPTAWRAFLKAYFGGSASGTGIPVFTNPNKLAASLFDQDGFTVQGTLDAQSKNSLARVTMLTGLVLPKPSPSTGFFVAFTGETDAQTDGTTVQGIWDLSVLSLAQGSNVGFGFSTVSTIAGGKKSLDILFVYRKSPTAPLEDCIRQLVFIPGANGASPTLTSDTYYVLQNGVVGELNPVAGSELIPIVKTLDLDTNAEDYEAGADVPFTATAGPNGTYVFNLTLEYKSVNSGVRILSVLTAQNAKGEGDAVAAAGNVP